MSGGRRRAAAVEAPEPTEPTPAASRAEQRYGKEVIEAMKADRFVVTKPISMTQKRVGLVTLEEGDVLERAAFGGDLVDLLQQEAIEPTEAPATKDAAGKPFAEMKTEETPATA